MEKDNDNLSESLVDWNHEGKRRAADSTPWLSLRRIDIEGNKSILTPDPKISMP